LTWWPPSFSQNSSCLYIRALVLSHGAGTSTVLWVSSTKDFIIINYLFIMCFPLWNPVLGYNLHVPQVQKGWQLLYKSDCVLEDASQQQPFLDIFATKLQFNFFPLKLSFGLFCSDRRNFKVNKLSIENFLLQFVLKLFPGKTFLNQREVLLLKSQNLLSFSVFEIRDEEWWFESFWCYDRFISKNDFRLFG
jgi:hypothetical protein